MSLISKIGDAVKKEISSGDLVKKVEDITGTSVEDLGSEALDKAKDVVEAKTRSKSGFLGLVNKIVKQ